MHAPFAILAPRANAHPSSAAVGNDAIGASRANETRADVRPRCSRCWLSLASVLLTAMIIMAAFKNILVATDFGEAARHAGDVACELAAKFGAKLTLLHVWTVPTPAYAEMITLPLDRIQRAAEEAMATEAQRLRAKFGELRTIVVPGVAWRAIIEAAQEEGFDLVVIGTHGRKGMPRLFLGSVAEKVVRASPVPVLTVHSP
jgi:nucleotide-binding universal stress UspA family protein